MRVCILGATGAIGKPITQFFENISSVIGLNSRNCNLNSELDITGLSVEPCNIFINAAGTFGGLKSYENENIAITSNYYKNLNLLVDKLQPKIIINISSACLSNIENHRSVSSYYTYAQIKKNIENIFTNKDADAIIHLRCTNIISQYENYVRSRHSIASIYKKYLTNQSSIKIWSHAYDWREYLDADDLITFFPKIIRLRGNHILTIGSGQKSYMHEVINYFNYHMHYRGQIQYTEPHKRGPQMNLASVPDALLSGNEVEMTPLKNSIHKCVTAWNAIHIKDKENVT